MASQDGRSDLEENYEQADRWVKALEKSDECAKHAMDAERYEKAAFHYECFIRDVDGELDSRHPSILWPMRRYSEALMKLNRVEEADEIQQGLLDRLDPVYDDEERAVIEEVLYLRLKRAVALHAQAELESMKEAADVLWKATLHSARVLGTTHIVTTTIRDNLKVIDDDKTRLVEKQVKKKMRKQSRSTKPPIYASMEPVVPSSMPQTPPPVPRTPKPSIRLPINNKVMHQPARDETTNIGSLAPESANLSPLLAVRHDEIQLARDRRLSDSQVRAIQSPLGGITRDGPAARPRSSSQRPGAEELVASQEIVRSRSAQAFAPKQQKGTAQPQSLSDARLLSGSPDDCAATDNWFVKYLSRCHTLLDMYPLLKSAPGKRVRIAVIDTGLNRHHPEVADLLASDEEEQRIKACESWLPDSSRGGFLPGDEDEAGHGTHCAMVTHKVAPNADIFVARVFKNEDNVVGTYVTDAINHAVKVWKVDIISMSFALSSRDQENNKKVSMAIEEATARGCPRPVLFFAAASNDGKNAGTTFPATHRDVTCMYAAKGGGAFVRDMNPDMLWDDVNFSALGMYVDAPHRGSSNQRMSGTSVATPVAAGIAALVLEFVRQRRVDGQQPITVVEALKTKRGMMRAFWLMRNTSVPTQISKKEPFNLKPWYLLGSDFKSGDNDIARKAARVAIASDLNRALAGLDP